MHVLSLNWNIFRDKEELLTLDVFYVYFTDKSSSSLARFLDISELWKPVTRVVSVITTPRNYA
jgi:hypothetical protein